VRDKTCDNWVKDHWCRDCKRYHFRPCVGVATTKWRNPQGLEFGLCDECGPVLTRVGEKVGSK